MHAEKLMDKGINEVVGQAGDGQEAFSRAPSGDDCISVYESCLASCDQCLQRSMQAAVDMHIVSPSTCGGGVDMSVCFHCICARAYLCTCPIHRFCSKTKGVRSM